MVKKKKRNLPPVQETQVQSLHLEDPLEQDMATYSIILGLENSMDKEIWWTSMGFQRVGHN